MDPSLTDLRYFQEVARTGNISRAAERLLIRQSSLSEAMKRLERIVGTPLMSRSKAGVTLTKAGRVFVEASAATIQNWEHLRASVNVALNEVTGRYSFGCHANPASYILPRFLPSLLAEHPGLRVELVHARSQHLYEMVISSKLDFAIVSVKASYPDLVVVPLFRDTIGFWQNPKLKVDPADTPLLFDPDLHYTQYMLNELANKKIHFRRKIESPSLEVIWSLAEEGAGVAMLPRNPVRFSKSVLRAVPGFPEASGPQCLIYRSDAAKSVAAKSIIKAIREECQRAFHED